MQKKIDAEAFNRTGNLARKRGSGSDPCEIIAQQTVAEAGDCHSKAPPLLSSLLHALRLRLSSLLHVHLQISSSYSQET